MVHLTHVVIRQDSYVAGTRELLPVGILTQTLTSRPPVPWGNPEVGDPVWKKWSETPLAVDRVTCADVGERVQRLGQALGQLRQAMAAARATSRRLDTIERTFYPEV
jgi:hypothetical protein